MKRILILVASLAPLTIEAVAEAGTRIQCIDGRKIKCEWNQYRYEDESCRDIGPCESIDKNLRCTVFDYTSQVGKVVKMSFDVPVVNGTTKSVSAGAFTGKVHIYNPSQGNHQRIDLGLKATDPEGKILSANTFVDDVVPPFLFTSIAHGDVAPAGALQCITQ